MNEAEHFANCYLLSNGVTCGYRHFRAELEKRASACEIPSSELTIRHQLSVALIDELKHGSKT